MYNSGSSCQISFTHQTSLILKQKLNFYFLKKMLNVKFSFKPKGGTK